FTIAPDLLPRHQSFVSTSALQMTSCLQLIQYAPSTIEVKRRPLIIVPPWINKFYVLDLRPETSFIKWAVDQGHTVFVISRRTIWPWPAGMGGMGIMACRWFGQSTRAGWTIAADRRRARLLCSCPYPYRCGQSRKYT